MNKKQSVIGKMLEAFAKFKTELEAEGQVPTEATAEAAAVKLATAMIDGVTIEAEEFEVGQAVFAISPEGERVPLEEGAYRTEEGNAFTVDESGVIISIGEAEEVAEEEVVAEQEMTSEEAPAKKVIESQTVSKETFFSAIAELKTELKADIEAIKKAHSVELADKDKQIEGLRAELSATPSEVATRVAPTSDANKPLAHRAKGVARTTQDRVLERMFANAK